MTSDSKPLSAAVPDKLHEDSIAAVLLYGLTLDHDDPALGVLHGVRNELSLIANLVQTTQPGADFDLTEIEPVLEGMVRRLDVAFELMDRAKRARGTSGPADGSNTALDGILDGTEQTHDRD